MVDASVAAKWLLPAAQETLVEQANRLLAQLLESLTAKYGSRIPVDHAFKIMQDLETGRGYTPDE